LLPHVAQRVGRALAVVLVDRDEVGEIEHVDFLELARRAEFRRHHVQRHVHQRHDRGIPLADARGLDHDQIEAGNLACGDRLGQRFRDLRSRGARGERAHENVAAVDRVHTDAVAQQRPAALAPRRVPRRSPRC